VVDFQGSQHVTPNTDNQIAWNLDKHFLDMMVCIGKGLGLDAMVPNMEIDHTYKFGLDLEWPYWNFSAKFVKLGFDPIGSMLFLRCSRSEDVWLAWIPQDGMDCDDSKVDNMPARTCSGSTRLQK